MIERGAKHLAFISRSGTDSPSAAALVASIRALSVNVQILRADVASKEQLAAALQEIDSRFPVRGVVNAAVVLQVLGFYISFASPQTANIWPYRMASSIP